jgi:phospholipid:diacylglycerol acyltransferase
MPQVGYQYALSGKPYPDSWILTDVIYENEGGVLQSRLGKDLTSLLII